VVESSLCATHQWYQHTQNAAGSFPRVKRPGRGADHPRPRRKTNDKEILYSHTCSPLLALNGRRQCELYTFTFSLLWTFYTHNPNTTTQVALLSTAMAIRERQCGRRRRRRRRPPSLFKDIRYNSYVINSGHSLVYMCVLLLYVSTCLTGHLQVKYNCACNIQMNTST